MWTRLQDLPSWYDYQHTAMQALGVVGMEVAWNAGPQQYPCLVSSCLRGPTTVFSVYVYLDDAKLLLGQGTLSTVLEALAANRSIASPTALTPAFDQAARDRAVNAHLMTLMDLIIGVGISTADRYAGDYLRRLAKVDQLTAEDREMLESGRLPESCRLTD
jgi:hypothetical protein